MFPLQTLHVVHELFTVAIVEENSDFGFIVILKVEPEFLDFNSLVIHVLSQIFHSDVCLTLKTLYLGIDDFDVYDVFVLDFELETLVENGVVFWLWLGRADVLHIELITSFSFNLHGDVWSNKFNWKISCFNDI